MKDTLALFLGFTPPRASFQGTVGEERVYRAAVLQWRAAGFHIRNEQFLNRTLGAKVSRRAA